MAEPLGEAEVPALGNRFMSWAHDDGWYLKLYYNDWRHITHLVSPILDRLGVRNNAREFFDDIRKAGSAWWISNGRATTYIMTHDIDSVLNTRPR